MTTTFEKDYLEWAHNINRFLKQMKESVENQNTVISLLEQRYTNMLIRIDCLEVENEELLRAIGRKKKYQQRDRQGET